MMKKIKLTMVVLTIAGCGIKGPPLPPLKEETIQSQAAFDEGVAASADASKPIVKPKPRTPPVKKKNVPNEN